MLTSKSIAEETNILALSMMINPNKLLKKYNINSNADLFNAMVDEIGNDVNIFNSNDYIRYSYFILYFFCTKLYPLIEYFSAIFLLFLTFLLKFY